MLVALSLVVLAGLASLPGSVHAAPRLSDEPFELTAESIEYEAKRQIYVAEGNVRIVQANGRRLEAEWVAFNNQTRRGIASGDVVLVDGERRVDAQFAEFDLDTLEGLAFEGKLSAGQVRLWAKEMLKTGPDTYWMDDVGMTTCDCPDPTDRTPWQIESSEADVEVGGYATAWNSTIEILEVPLLWFPWLMVPVKTDRESGLLFPEFGFGGKNGYEVSLPLFLAIGDPVNVTLTPRYLSKRGIKPEATVEYVFGKKSKGALYGTFIRDKEVVTDSDWRKDNSKNPDGFSADRWALRSESQTFLPGKVQVNGEINLVSDNDYTTDFDDLRTFRRNRFLESNLFGTRHFLADGSLAGVLGLAYVDDIANPDDVDRDDFLLQRAPALNVESMHTRVPGGMGLVTAFDFDYVHFWAQHDPDDKLDLAPEDMQGGRKFADIGFDSNTDFQELSRRARLNGAVPQDPHKDNFTGSNSGPQGDGRFQEGEPLGDRGHRFMAHPRVSRPTQLFDMLEFTPEVGYQQVFYTTDAQDEAERGVYTARADLSTTLQRNFDLAGRGTLSHLMIPNLGFVLAESRNQKGDPFFVPKTARPQRRLRQLERENVIRDPADRIADTQQLVLGVGNRFWQRNPQGRDRIWGEFSLSASYDFQDEAFDRIILDGRSLRVGGVATRFNLSVDAHRGDIDEGLLDVSYARRNGFILGARYRYLDKIPLFFEDFKGENGERFDRAEEDFDSVSQVDGRIRLPIGERLALGYAVNYSIEDDIFLTNRGTVDIISACKCWALQFEVRDHRTRGLQFSFQVAIMGFGKEKADPFAGNVGIGTGSTFK